MIVKVCVTKIINCVLVFIQFYAAGLDARHQGDQPRIREAEPDGPLHCDNAEKRTAHCSLLNCEPLQYPHTYEFTGEFNFTCSMQVALFVGQGAHLTMERRAARRVPREFAGPQRPQQEGGASVRREHRASRAACSLHLRQRRLAPYCCFPAATCSIAGPLAESIRQQSLASSAA